MANKLYNDTSIKAIADAIRAKNGKTDTYTVGEMAEAISSLSGKETVTWHQCPEAVRNYLDQVTYDPSDYSTSRIAEFAPSTAVSSNTKPIAEIVTGDSHRNEVPNEETPFSSTNIAGTLEPLDRLRWINTTPKTYTQGVDWFGSDEEAQEYVDAHPELPNRTIFQIYPVQPAGSVPNNLKFLILEDGELKFFSYYGVGVNTRDLGGWQCDGGTVKYGMLVRGGDTNPVDKRLMVDEIGIRTEVRLFELSHQGLDHSVWDIDYFANPTNSVVAGNLTDKVMWKALLEAIMKSVVNQKSVYFHCGAGLDRTASMAVMLEAILGFSQSDIDKDYELGSFASGSSDTTARKRSNAGHKNFIEGILATPLLYGLSNTFRNHAISFVLSCGVKIDLINAFRKACIDGNPEVITVNIPTHAITQSLTHATTDNTATTIKENEPYEANITPEVGYIISGVSITMNGEDVSGCFSGEIGNLKRSVAKILVGCTVDNPAGTVIDGQGYAAEITVNDGYTLTNADVSIMMDGVDITNQVYIAYEEE